MMINVYLLGPLQDLLRVLCQDVVQYHEEDLLFAEVVLDQPVLNIYTLL